MTVEQVDVPVEDDEGNGSFQELLSTGQGMTDGGGF